MMKQKMVEPLQSPKSINELCQNLLNSLLPLFFMATRVWAEWDDIVLLAVLWLIYYRVACLEICAFLTT